VSSPEAVSDQQSAVDTTIDGSVARIVLNLPERLNCLTAGMREELGDALEALAEVDELRVVVVTGAGRAFCAGADLDGIASLVDAGDHEGFARLVQAGARVVRQIRDLPVPVIAAVNGVASGAGAALAIACDLRIASQDAAIGFGFSRMGLHPDWGATHFLPRQVGTGRAAELFLSGRTVSAAEAERLGLFERVAPAATFADAVNGYAQELADKPALPMRLLKRTLFDGGGHIAMEEALRQEAEAQVACFRNGHLSTALARRT
jgi:2-(1,2-epoxy-1,2-dihydrophenyl)acetyl-CoA isomerase